MHSAAKSRNSVGGFTSSNVGPLFSFGNSFGTGVVETPAEIFRSDLPRLDNLSQWIAQLSHRCPLWVKSRHFGMSDRCLLYPRKRTPEGHPGPQNSRPQRFAIPLAKMLRFF